MTAHFVNTTDEMTFVGDQIPPMKVAGKEGYFVNEQGGLGDYFIETNGQTYRMVKVGENVWSYTTPADVRELSRFGFPESASGKHVLVKVVTTEQGLETHQISRLTSVSWKDKEGKDRTLQFITLQGFHKRQRVSSQPVRIARQSPTSAAVFNRSFSGRLQKLAGSTTSPYFAKKLRPIVSFLDGPL